MLVSRLGIVVRLTGLGSSGWGRVVPRRGAGRVRNPAFLGGVGCRIVEAARGRLFARVMGVGRRGRVVADRRVQRRCWGRRSSRGRMVVMMMRLMMVMVMARSSSSRRAAQGRGGRQGRRSDGAAS